MQIPVNKIRVFILCIAALFLSSNIRIITLRWLRVADLVIVQSIGRTLWEHRCAINMWRNEMNMDKIRTFQVILNSLYKL